MPFWPDGLLFGEWVCLDGFFVLRRISNCIVTATLDFQRDALTDNGLMVVNISSTVGKP